MSPTTAPRRRADPDGLLAATLLGLLGTAGMFYVNVLPAMVSGLRDALGYTNVQAGYVASANVYGAAAGALCAVFIVGRLPWKRVQAVMLGALVAADLLSMLVTSLPLLIGVRAIDGLCGGTSIGIALAVMARTGVPQRAYGAQFTLQVLLGGLGLMFLPELAARHGVYVVFVAMAAVSAVTLMLLPLLAEYPIRKAVSTADGRAVPAGPLLATLVSLFLFQAANMALYAFIIPLGRSYHLPLGFISNTLAAADWLAALGSVLAMGLGLRFGRLRPLVLVLLISAPATAAFLWSGDAAVFIGANILSGLAWSFTIPCLFSLCAALDPSGRSAALGGFFSKMGLASGPLVAPFIIGADRYPRLIGTAVLMLLLVLVFAVWPAARFDRRASA